MALVRAHRTNPVRIGICGPHRLLRRSLADALGEAPGIDVVGVRRTASSLRSLELDAAVVLLPATRERAVELIGDLAPTPVVAVSSQRGRDAAGVVWCDPSSTVAEIEMELRLIVEDTTRVAVLVEGRSAGPRKSASLSDRELQVLRLVSRGLTAEQIAELLHLSPRTVANHKARVFAKLGVQNQSHAVATAMREGLLVARAEDSIPRAR